MVRIERAFAQRKAEGRKVFVAYLTAGDPDLETTEKLALALEAAGVDILEIGVPFSDPTADGPVIQAASQRALMRGTTLAGILERIASLRRRSDIPVVLFGYFNPILSYGVERFARDAAAAGVDGLLVVDLPFEESGELRRYSDPASLAFISLVAPTTDAARARNILRRASGFVYAISVTGVTGTSTPIQADIRRDLQRFRAETDLPIVAGFGIATAGQAAGIAPLADGIVVGSALVRLIAEKAGRNDLVETAASYAREIRMAIDGKRRKEPAGVGEGK
ncbi:MAG TPA: tryptophan synthase subunit alpha [Syntrophales bacterium]|jgi:tryptophan synthase alpha chain|nr:tryptophan synthase subunit alpha [Syntrophales bacterium]